MTMKILFAVPWIEVESGWGSRPKGLLVFDDLTECIERTIKDSETGNYDGGYMGPKRPLGYYETSDSIQGTFPIFVKNLKFKTDFNYIDWNII